MMRWEWNPRDFEGVERHLDGLGIAGVVLMIILWAAVVTALVFGIRALILYSRRNRPLGPDGAEALDPGAQAGSAQTSSGLVPPPTAKNGLLAILEERYARGEIDRDEFLQRKQDLGIA